MLGLPLTVSVTRNLAVCGGGFPLNVNNNHRLCSPNLLSTHAGWFYINLTEAGVFWEKETLMEKKSTPDWLAEH